MFAVDFDGTVADTGALKRDWIRDRGMGEFAPWHYNRSDLARLAPDLDYGAMLDHVCCQATLTSRPIAGAERALAALSKAGPVYILTVRDGAWLDYAIEWLTAHGLRRFITREVSQGRRPKPEVAAELGCKVLIDDEGGNLSPPPPGMLGIHLRLAMPEPVKGVGTVCASWEEATVVSLRHVGSRAAG